MEKLRIREATEKGYAEVEVGGVFDASYPTSKTRRGRVQQGGGGLSDTDISKAGDILLRGCMDRIVHIGNLYGPDRGTGYAGNIWGKQGLAPALTTMGGHERTNDS